METFAFQAEINQLLSLIINAFYSNKEVFLRELISNGIDALDKVRYQSLSNGHAVNASDTGELAIHVKGDRDSMTLTIEDTGVGMTQADLIKNLGTIAHSGTRSFIEAMKAGNADVSLIGQFGVGFYSAFLVADKVTVYSKSDASDSVYTWESNAGGSFTVGKTEDDVNLKRGTRIILNLKEGMAEYAEEQRLCDIIKKHSEYSTFPIYLWTKKTREEEIPDEKIKEDENTKEDGEVEDITNDEDDKKNKEPQKRTVEYHEYDHINKIKPAWQRKPEDVSTEEHEALFKSLSNDWEPPLGIKHFEVDGNIQFKAVLYVPKNAPVEIFQQKKKKNIKLYVKKVFVTDDADELVPDYLNFIHGVVDSDDLPLNVSREMLQQNKIMGSIKKNLVKKSLELFSDISEDTEKYSQFYKKFSKNIKLGVHDDAANRSKLVEFLRFYSTHSPTQMTSLKEYKNRMKNDQEYVYFVTSDNIEAARKSPCIEKLVSLGYEVLLMIDPMDEYLMQVLHEYDDKKFSCCSRVGLKIPGQEEVEEVDKKHPDLLKLIKDTLGARVHKVTTSPRLTTSPCVLVTDAYGWTANMERIVKAQALRDSDDFMTQYMVGKRIFEINPDHQIIKYIASHLDDKQVSHFVNMVYRTALISSGFSLDDPIEYAHRIFSLMEAGVSDIDTLMSEFEDTLQKKVNEEQGMQGKDDRDIENVNEESSLEEVD